MARIPFWGGETLEEQAWNFVWLGEDLLPGIAEVTAEKGRAIDVQKSPGSDGATIKDNGFEPGTVDITLRILTREQWEAWQDVLPKIDPQKAGGRSEEQRLNSSHS